MDRGFIEYQRMMDTDEVKLVNMTVEAQRHENLLHILFQENSLKAILQSLPVLESPRMFEMSQYKGDDTDTTCYQNMSTSPVAPPRQNTQPPPRPIPRIRKSLEKNAQTPVNQQIQFYRCKLEQCILQNTNPEERKTIVDVLLGIYCLAINMKYKRLDLLTLLCSNTEPLAISNIPAAFNLLEKYATNLLKPEALRHQSWRNVQFNSLAYKQKVRFLIGAEKILNWLGYTENITCDNTIIGLVFPTSKQPNERLVLNLAVDLSIAKFEVEAIITCTHPNLQNIQNFDSIPAVYFQHSPQQTNNQMLTDNLQSDNTVAFALSKRVVSSYPNNFTNKPVAPSQMKLPSKVFDKNYESMNLQQNLEDKGGTVLCVKCFLECPDHANFCNKCGNSLKQQKQQTHMANNLPKKPSENNSIQKPPIDSPLQNQLVGSLHSLNIRESDNMDNTFDPKKRWKCFHCTYLNNIDTRVCEMCDRTSWQEQPDKIQKIENTDQNEFTLINNTPSPGGQEFMQKEYESFVVLDQPNQPELKTTGLLKTASGNSLRQHITPSYEIDKRVSLPDNLQKYNEQHHTSKLDQVDSGISLPQKQPLKHQQNAHETAQTGISMHDIQKPNTYQDQTHDQYKQHLHQRNSFKEIEQIQYQEALKQQKYCEEEVRKAQRLSVIRQQSEMKKYGKNMVSIFKLGENHGFSVEECCLACQNVHILNCMYVQQWLENDWLKLIQDVLNLVKDIHQSDEMIGLISVNEAKELLIECDGRREETVQKFIEKRGKQVAEMTSMDHSFTMNNIIDALYRADGNMENAKDIIKGEFVEKFRKNIFLSKDDINNEYYAKLTNKDIDNELKCRTIIGQNNGLSWGRAENCVQLIDLGFPVADALDAVTQNQHIKQCLNYLEHKCETCYDKVSVNGLISSFHCQCQFCYECYANYIRVTVSEKHIRDLVCPLCQKPNLDSGDITHYFDNLGHQIRYMVKQKYLPEQIIEQFENKLCDFHLMKDEKFRWCDHCKNGFIWEDANCIKMTCDKCKEHTCYKCKQKWQPQHDNITCEEFKAWQEANDPALQQAGVAGLLAKNGLECPECHFQYDLARGGCMHFTCIQCKFEFCQGCAQGFRKGAQCQFHASCESKGLHTHHPRDCLYYMRDFDVKTLQKLLQLHNVKFDTDVPEQKKALEHVKCDMMEQKQHGEQLKDEACGADAPQNMAGICEKHYKEYLVALINRNSLDPVEIMTTEELKTVIQRCHKDVIDKQPNEEDKYHFQRLKQYTLAHVPLPARKKDFRAPQTVMPNHDQPVLEGPFHFENEEESD